MEVKQLHPCTHEFWEEDNVRKSLLDFLVGWSRNPKAYVMKTLQAQDNSTHSFKGNEQEENKVESGFVDGLYCTRVLSGYRHSFGSFLFNSFICF